MPSAGRGRGTGTDQQLTDYLGRSMSASHGTAPPTGPGEGGLGDPAFLAHTVEVRRSRWHHETSAGREAGQQEARRAADQNPVEVAPQREPAASESQAPVRKIQPAGVQGIKHTSPNDCLLSCIQRSVWSRAPGVAYRLQCFRLAIFGDARRCTKQQAHLS